MALPGQTEVTQTEHTLPITRQEASPVPQSMAHVGATVEALGGEIGRIAKEARIKAQEASALEMESKYQTALQAKVFDPINGFSSLHGKDAANHYAEVKQTTQDLRMQMAGQMGSLLEQRLFLANSQRILRFAQDHIDAHTAHQIKLDQQAQFHSYVTGQIEAGVQQVDSRIATGTWNDDQDLTILFGTARAAGERAQHAAELDMPNNPEYAAKQANEARSAVVSAALEVALKNPKGLDAGQAIFKDETLHAMLGPKALVHAEALEGRLALRANVKAATQVIEESINKKTGLVDPGAVSKRLTEIGADATLRQEVFKQENVRARQAKMESDGLAIKVMQQLKLGQRDAAAEDIAQLRNIAPEKLDKVIKQLNHDERAAKDDLRKDQKWAHTNMQWRRQDADYQHKMRTQASFDKLGGIKGDLATMDEDELKKVDVSDFANEGLSGKDFDALRVHIDKLQKPDAADKAWDRQAYGIGKSIVDKMIGARRMQPTYYGRVFQYMQQEHEKNPDLRPQDMVEDLTKQLTPQGFLGFGGRPIETLRVKDAPAPKKAAPKPEAKAAPKAAPEKWELVNGTFQKVSQ